uniref:Uncharacterized protein n=1 Tax=Rhizophora mucronata TaxID=61149 RepID=A0A2P2P493_RHIMU
MTLWVKSLCIYSFVICSDFLLFCFFDLLT